MTDAQLALLADTRLSREARVMGLYISSKGEGEHEIPHDEFRVILGRGPRGLPKDQTIAGYVQELQAHDWIDRSPGGSGSPRYNFTHPSREGKSSTHPPGEGRAKILPTPHGWAEGFYPPLTGGQSHTVVGRREVDGRREVEEGAREIGPRYPLAEDAGRVIEEASGELNGCRGSLRDYLRRRVPTSRQYAFVRTVQGWLEGTDRSVFALSDGSQLPEAEQTGYLAAAWNELLAADERKMKRDPGDPGNTKTKLNILLRQRGTDAKTGRTTGSRSRSQLASNHGEYHVE